MRRSAPGLCFLPFLLLAAPVMAGTTTILECHFDTETIDAPIGTGGPSVGQPISLGGAPAFVRTPPMTTPSLEIGDDSATTAESVRFEFLNGWAIDTGTLTVSMNLWFHSLQGYQLLFREKTNASISFLTLRFDGSGNVRYGDIDSPGNTAIGVYTTGSVLPLTVTFDLDAKTYDINLNGSMLRTAESMGTFAEGIGGILLGATFDGDFDGLVSVDDLLVTATSTPTSVDAATWGSIKAGWRGE